MSFKGLSPVLYSRNNKLQRRDGRRFLEENIQRMTWRGGDRVLDIGSGDGSFTAEVLRSYLPQDLALLVGSDRSEEMVRYANERYRGERLSFQRLEIGATLPSEFIGLFDHVFSFYALQWISDLRLAISQIYDLLCEGGDCLHLALGKAPVAFDIYKRFAGSERWSRWVRNLEELASPFRDSADPESVSVRMAKEVGFKNIFVKCARRSYTYESVEHFKGMMASISPFDIPDELVEEYMEEFLEMARAEGHLSADLTIEYYTYTLYMRK